MIQKIFSQLLEFLRARLAALGTAQRRGWEKLERKATVDASRVTTSERYNNSMASTVFEHQARGRREVAITFDDLPLQPPIRDPVAINMITRKLLGRLVANGVSAVGFVNEGELYENGRADEARVAVLKMWLDAGQELGNHTFSHCDLNSTSLNTYLDDILRGELITKELLYERGMKMNFFRHPYLHTGIEIGAKCSVEEFLSARGYEIAPVTTTSQEWAFARVYDEAKIRGDRRIMRRISEAYIPYMEEVFKYAESISVELIGYEIKQALLLHASALNADYFDDLARMIKGRGYSFIELSRALEDEAYLSPDTYVGSEGLSWLQRRAADMGKRLRAAPKTPEIVRSAVGRFGV
jgi:peptidoglycan/xylan/chitin deacetylase (PgdA/CDA1 family)